MYFLVALFGKKVWHFLCSDKGSKKKNEIFVITSFLNDVITILNCHKSETERKK